MTLSRDQLNPFFSDTEQQDSNNKNYKKRASNPRDYGGAFSTSWPNPPTASPTTNLAKLTRLIAERELIVYQRVGMRSTIRNQFQEITTYFNGTTNKAAFACYFYANFYDGKTTTSGRAAHRLGINRSSVYSIITHCLKKEWAIESSKAKYHASPFFVSAWHNYVEQEIKRHTELFRISNALAEAYLTEKSGVLPIK